MSKGFCIALVLAAGIIFTGCPKQPTTKSTGANQSTRDTTVIPPVPREENPVKISVAYPPPGTPKPKVDSNFIFGTVQNGTATLYINGALVPVHANGGFLAFLPMPIDGSYLLTASTAQSHDSLVVSYAPNPVLPGSGSQDNPTTFSPRLGIVIKGSDTLETGSDVAVASPTRGADRKWFFPNGARVHADTKIGRDLKLALDTKTDAWIADSNVRFDSVTEASTPKVGLIRLDSYEQFSDLRIQCGFAPFLISGENRELTIEFYDRPLGSQALLVHSGDQLISSMGWQTASFTGSSSHSPILQIELSKPLWGYKAFYQEDGSLVIRIRKPPVLDKSDPLRGLRIVLDPGHPPAGAIGPTGLTEAEANLAIALRLEKLLRSRGANVLMTHTTTNGMISNTDQTAELRARVQYAVDQNADLLLSIHNNAFPDGTNPFLNYGTSTYYYHQRSAPFARALAQEVGAVTGIPNQGAKQKSLALCRPMWMPASLTESLYMMFPEQEAALRDPAFLDRLAAAHLRGIEAFLLGTGI